MRPRGTRLLTAGLVAATGLLSFAIGTAIGVATAGTDAVAANTTTSPAPTATTPPSTDAPTTSTTSTSTTSTSTTSTSTTSTSALPEPAERIDPPPADAPAVVVVATADGRIGQLDPTTGELLNVLDEGVFGRIQVASEVVYYAVGGSVRSVPLDGSAPPETVTEGTDPAVSLDGSKLAVIRSGALVVIDLDSGDETVVDHSAGLDLSHPSFAPESGAAVATQHHPDGSTQLIVFDTDNLIEPVALPQPADVDRDLAIWRRRETVVAIDRRADGGNSATILAPNRPTSNASIPLDVTVVAAEGDPSGELLLFLDEGGALYWWDGRTTGWLADGITAADW